MFNTARNILSLVSSDCVMVLNCPENSSISILEEETSITPNKQDTKLLFPLLYHFQNIELSKRLRKANDKKVEERTKGEGEKRDRYNDRDDAMIEGSERHTNEIPSTPPPALSSSDSTASSYSSSSSKEENYIDSSHCSSNSEEASDAYHSSHSSNCTSKEDYTKNITTERKDLGADGMDLLKEESTKAKLWTETTKKKQLESNTYTIYYSIKVTEDKNDDKVPLAERGETKADLKREMPRPITPKHSNTTTSSTTKIQERNLQKQPLETVKARTTKTIAEAVRRMKKSSIQNEEGKKLNRFDCLYEQGKQRVSAKRQLARVLHEEMNKTAQLEKKFQERRRDLSRSTASNQKRRALSLYDLSKPKQLEGRMRRIEIMNKARRKAELLRSPSVCSSRYSLGRAYSYYSISSGGTATTTSRNKSSSEEEEKSNSSLSDEECTET